MIKSEYIILHNGVLFRAEMIDCPEADRIANANDFLYVERMVSHYPNGTFFKLNTNTGRVIRTIELEKKETKK